MVREGSGQHNINFINQCTLQHNTDDADYDDDDTNDDDLIMKIAWVMITILLITVMTSLMKNGLTCNNNQGYSVAMIMYESNHNLVSLMLLYVAYFDLQYDMFITQVSMWAHKFPKLF